MTCSPQIPAPVLAGLPVLALALITISGPPATRAALSRVATTAPAAMGAMNSCQASNLVIRPGGEQPEASRYHDRLEHRAQHVTESRLARGNPLPGR